MTELRYTQAKKIFLDICDLPADQITERLEQVCAGDPTLRKEIESLLEHHERSTRQRGASVDAATVARSGTPADSSSDAPALMRPGYIGSFRLVRELGAGGFGVVYLAERTDEKSPRYVAIKLIQQDRLRQEERRANRERFKREQRLLSNLHHPGIARLYEVGETDTDQLFFVMEYVEGLEIEEYCDAHRLRIDERLELFKQVCEAVHYVHQNLIVHRDLKPANILVTADGKPKLLDFGIAKLLNTDLAQEPGDITGSGALTPRYASPEQVRGEPLTTATDVYSLGVILYELLSGHAPYDIDPKRRDELYRAICDVDPDRPSNAIERVEVVTTRTGDSHTIDKTEIGRKRETEPTRLRRRLAGDIDLITLKALRKAPQRRYESAQKFADDIDAHLRGLPVSAQPDTFTYRAGKFVARHRSSVSAAAIVVVALAAGVVGMSWQYAQATDARTRAERESTRANTHLSAVIELADKYLVDLHNAIQQYDGNIELREKFVGTAFDYLDGVAKQVDDDPSLQVALARAYRKIGDIYGGNRGESKGNIVDAGINYERSLEILARLESELPGDAEIRREHAFTMIALADLKLQANESGSTRAALDDYESALARLRAIADEDPADLVRRRDYGRALQNVAAAHDRLGHRDEALAMYREVLSLRKQLVRDRPDDATMRRDLTVTLNRVARMAQKQGDFDEAQARFEDVVAMRRETLQREPENSRHRRDYANALQFAGENLLQAGEWEQALTDFFTTSLEIRSERAAANPADIRAKRDLAIAYQMVGFCHLQLGDLERAGAAYREFDENTREIFDSAPDDRRNVLLRAASFRDRANLQDLLGDQARAIEQSAKGVDLFEEVARNAPQKPEYRQWLATARRALAERLIAAGRHRDARREVDEARSNLAELFVRFPDDASLGTDLADVHDLSSRLRVIEDDGPGAVEDALAAIDAIGRDEPSRLRTLADAHLANGDPEAAIDRAERALALLDDSRDEFDAETAAELRGQLEEIIRSAGD